MHLPQLNTNQSSRKSIGLVVRKIGFKTKHKHILFIIVCKHEMQLARHRIEPR